MRRLGLGLLLALGFASSAQACDWDAAMKGITWVLAQNRAAQRCFSEAYRCQQVPNRRGGVDTVGGCHNGFDSLILCSTRNPAGQTAIAGCPVKTQQALNRNGIR